MSKIASQITSLTIVYSTIYSGADQSKHQSSASLAFVWGIHRGPVNSPHKWPVTRKMFPFDDVIMVYSVGGHQRSRRLFLLATNNFSFGQTIKFFTVHGTISLRAKLNSSVEITKKTLLMITIYLNRDYEICASQLRDIWCNYELVKRNCELISRNY